MVGPVGAFRSRQPAFVNIVLLAIHCGGLVPCRDCTGTDALVLSGVSIHGFHPAAGWHHVGKIQAELSDPRAVQSV